jgi:hypothetical protein
MPWLLNGAGPQTLDAILSKFPSPLPATYHDRWGPKYAALDIWNTIGEAAS